MAVHDIVVVGGSFAGLSTAHYLLRHTIPKLEAHNRSNSSSQSYKVTLISTTDHFFFKVGSPRTVASPDLIPVDKVLLPIADGFKDYAADHFKLVIGTATSVDEGTKTISVSTHDGAGGQTNIPYATLVIATGSRSSSPLWTLQDTAQQTDAELKRVHAALQKASSSSVLIAGGGPAGVETAAYAYPKHETTILSGSTRLLTRLRPAIGQAAEAQLSKLGVRTIHNLRVISTATDPQNNNNKTTVTLSDNSTQTVDIYIDATGPRPNTSWLPSSLLSPQTSRVETDPTTLRTGSPNIYAIGDAASYSKLVLFDVNDAVRPLCSSILHDLWPSSSSGGKEGKPKEVPYKQMQKEMQVVPVGQKAGVGVVMGWKVPSWFVWMVKGRTYFIEKARGTVSGAEFVKA
ncbi:MAG: hypothetical protein Q9191_007201 [Dirinaria sp. TL-2023a]